MASHREPTLESKTEVDTKAEPIETAPDPDEDDLDDLDDVLDQFSAKPTASTTAPTASGPGRPPQTHEVLPSDPALEAQLAAGIPDLLASMDSNPQMQKEFEAMMAELLKAGQAETDAEAMAHIGKATEAVPALSAEKGAKGKDDNFQDTIKRTMERMQASSSSAEAATAGAGTEEDLLAQMMKELGGAGAGGAGEEDFNGMLMSMMAQLTHKEILYEPMKELSDKFPAWMEKNGGGKVGKEDMARYREQQVLVGEIVGRFEKKGYSDEDEGDREYIVERMQKMQAAGSPPPDLVGDMSAAQEALGELEGGCPTQ
ncbi:hypothetical protein B0A48_14948 [Cryoendolithus antarcticus]|uniref:Pex19-domain-containing protein n=1 Tax=Cryoendolithus antarcticus TaxID=1507870 RepID=A0A1V8SJ68_9PEZI|nr:hypothetical protein B0A48_14948 [Cryoendolithus antarcticus]